MMEHRSEFEKWYLNHDVLESNLSVCLDNDGEEYYFYTDTQLLYDAFCETKGQDYAVFTLSGEGDFEQLSNWLTHDAAVKFRDNWVKSSLCAPTASIFKWVTNRS